MNGVEEHEVIVVGGGPTGLMLAAELALAGVDVVVLERRPNQDLDASRAGGLLSRTIEVLDQRGVAERFVSKGQIHHVQAFSGHLLDISDFPTRHNYLLALWQRDFEPILAEWVTELGVPIRYGSEVIGATQHDDGVDVALADTALRARYAVGCDGGRSLVRKAAGIDFVGLDPSTSWMIAEVEMDDEPPVGMRHDRYGSHGLGRIGDGGPVRVVLTERGLDHDGEPTLDDLRAALRLVYDTDFGVRDPRWISRFTDMARQAASYRAGRILVAGDAAHIHSPHGGQGLNTGVQDAVNLGWKLAQVLRGASPDSLLDSYHDERHPVGARVLHNTEAQVALAKPDERHQALRDLIGDLVVMDGPRRHLAGMLCGLDIHYELGDGHPLLGRRMPDRDLQTAAGPTRVYELLHDARPVLLNLDAPVDDAPWTDRVRVAQATSDGPWELPVIGEVSAPAAVLIRPDGYVAWVGQLTDPALADALDRWCGATSPRPSA